eukprot:362355-Chlamydomonas_euryale.AAC.7
MSKFVAKLEKLADGDFVGSMSVSLGKGEAGQCVGGGRCGGPCGLHVGVAGHRQGRAMWGWAEVRQGNVCVGGWRGLLDGVLCSACDVSAEVGKLLRLEKPVNQ